MVYLYLGSLKSKYIGNLESVFIGESSERKVQDDTGDPLAMENIYEYAHLRPSREKGESTLSKVLLINFPGEEQVHATIGLVKELIRRGEKVIYYCTEKVREKIEATGAVFRSLDRFMPTHPPLEEAPFDKSFPNFLHSMEQLTTKLIPELKSEELDYVVFHAQMFAGKLIAVALGLPCVSFCTTFAYNLEAKIFQNLFVDSLCETAEYQAAVRQIANRYGLTIRSPYDFLFARGEINLVFTSRYLQPTDRYFDRTYKFVGSSIAEYYAENNLPLDQLKNRPVLSLSMGTAFNRPSDWYEQSVEAFGDMDIQVILSVGTQRQIGDFKRIPDNFIMTNAPQWAVLKHASAMISLGEINAIHSALIHSVPLVMIPVWGAQPLIANRVKRLGAGVVLDREKLTPSLLRESVEEVLNQPAYRVNAARIGETLREAGGVERAVEEIFALKKRLSGMTEPVGK